uniref:PDZ domain-containing protein n=1 Tax=Haemonchus placei TaxID=6290 RepID=A0A0N4VUR8_HAEPC
LSLRIPKANDEAFILVFSLTIQLFQATDPVFVAPPPPLEEPAMNKPRPRLCKLEKSSQSEEFGFNLHAEKGRGHFIGTVDQGGIGDRAGLRMGQRIVGVNGVLVYPNTPHKEVVAQIKRSPLRTTLLVASEDVDRWYKEHGAEFSFDYVEEEATNHHQQLSPHVSFQHSTHVLPAGANQTNQGYSFSYSVFFFIISVFLVYF